MSAFSYDLAPRIAVPGHSAADVACGWDEISPRLALAGAPGVAARVCAVECYPGVHADEVRRELERRLQPALTIDTVADAFRSPAEIDALVAPDLGGEDPVFGRWTRLQLAEFFDPARAAATAARIRDATTGLVLVVGPGAALLAPAAQSLVFADMPRWEGQLRQRRGEVDNLGGRNRGLAPSLHYKRSFFVDWRVADRVKRATMARWDFVLDTTIRSAPKLISGAAHRAAMQAAARRPFRVVPFFDPGPWGGQWMRRQFGLDAGPANFAWGFDCVPEENSLRLDFGGVTVEVPAQNLVFAEPRRLLGDPVQARFGAEFPIRFDLLDTIGGGNLSLQVHPDAEFAREHFGLWYTQDESYYLLAAEPGASVFLGRRRDASAGEMFAALAAAQRGERTFDAARFVAQFPARVHDHFLIPAGTLHCAGAGGVVLEISATPYIFTFKLWDWGRMGLDGRPRPVNLERGRQVLRAERDEDFARAQLVNRVRDIARGDGWREERTGLHETQFIETRRHWFTSRVPHDTGGAERGGVHVLNLVQGAAALVESPGGAFAPFEVHYAETFIVPAAVGAYTIRPHPAASGECATLKAFVR
jgi:mannose-6-phosphate isomerase class I